MKIQQIKFRDSKQNYSIIIGNNILKILSKKVKSLCPNTKKIALIFDKKIPNANRKIILKSLKGYQLFVYKFDANEKNKSISSVNILLNKLLFNNLNRSDLIIGVGGGIIGDLTGFVASIFKRGINFISVPTTLLAQVDASVGGKTGVNSKFGKNLIGSFSQPKLVVCDLSFLKSLPKKEMICGYAEILKHAIINDSRFFKWLTFNTKKIFSNNKEKLVYAIKKSCLIKSAIVNKDVNEKNLRMILNFGHTFAHAYEASLGYSKKLNHGEAVILGMKTALSFSLKNNLLLKNDYNSIINHISKANLPSKLKKFFKIKDLNKILSFMVKDKKNNSDKINLVLLKKIGSPMIDKEYNKNNLSVFLKNELRN